MSFAKLKQECFETNIELAKKGLIDLTFGNASVIDRNLGVFAIKPSGVSYSHLTPGDMVILDLDGKVLDGSLKPSSDMPTHRILLKEFKSANSVVHTHSRNATSFAQAGKSIPCLGTTHADYFYGPIPVTRDLSTYEIQSQYELNTGKVITETFLKIDSAKMPAVLVRNHGVFTWGPSGKKAVENAFALELVAEMAARALQLNPLIQPISQELLDRHFNRKHGAKSYYGQTPVLNV